MNDRLLCCAATPTISNEQIQLQDLGNKDYKETWEYQEELFKGIVDLKIRIGERNSN
jgi:hypothetical protein